MMILDDFYREEVTVEIKKRMQYWWERVSKDCNLTAWQSKRHDGDLLSVLLGE